MNPRNRLALRLRPLYVAVFCMSFVLWYAIEKLFLRSIGFDDALIGVLFAVISTTILLAEIPAGVLADRWSRRGVLLLGVVVLAVATGIGALSNEPSAYFVSAILWALFFALYTGMCDSIIYDTILEEKVATKQFDYYLGKVRIMISAATVGGSLLGGIVGQFMGLRWTYWFTIPVVLVALVALVKLREPKLHKVSQSTALASHLVGTLKSLLRHRYTLWLVATLALVSALVYTVLEFTQLWSIALLAPIVLYGPINALHGAAGGIGGYIVGRVQLARRPTMAITLAIVLVSSVGMAVSRHLAVTVVAIALYCIGLFAVMIVFNRYLHDVVPSTVRAGASSIISTLSRIIIVPLSLGIGYLSSQTDIFHATWLIIGLTVVLVGLIVRSYFGKHALH